MATKKKANTNTKKRVTARAKAAPQPEQQPATQPEQQTQNIDPPRIEDGVMYIAPKDLERVQKLFDAHKLRKLEAEVIHYRVRDEKERHASALAGLHQDLTKATQLATEAQKSLLDLENAIADTYGIGRSYSYEPTTGKIFEQPK